MFRVVRSPNRSDSSWNTRFGVIVLVVGFSSGVVLICLPAALAAGVGDSARATAGILAGPKPDTAPTPVTLLVSPAGDQLAYPEVERRYGPDVKTRLVVSRLDGSQRREIKVLDGDYKHVFWFGNDRLLCSANPPSFNWHYWRGHADELRQIQRTLRVISLSGQELPPLQMPPGCDDFPGKSISPDGQLWAFVGTYTPPGTAAAKYPEQATYVAEPKTGKVRRIYGLAKGDSFAWSPDSRRLLLSVEWSQHRDRLAIVDVSTARATETKIHGLGGAWSPDGRQIAFTTDRESPPSAGIGGVASAGRIGVMDVATAACRWITPAASVDGQGFDGQQRQCWFGCPAWSPDGRWLSFFVGRKQGTDLEQISLQQLWLTNAQGTQFRRVLDAERFAWADVLSDASREKHHLARPALKSSIPSDAPDWWERCQWSPQSDCILYVHDGQVRRHPIDSLPALSFDQFQDELQRHIE